MMGSPVDQVWPPVLPLPVGGFINQWNSVMTAVLSEARTPPGSARQVLPAARTMASVEDKDIPVEDEEPAVAQLLRCQRLTPREACPGDQLESGVAVVPSTWSFTPGGSSSSACRPDEGACSKAEVALGPDFEAESELDDRTWKILPTGDISRMCQEIQSLPQSPESAGLGDLTAESCQSARSSEAAYEGLTEAIISRVHAVIDVTSGRSTPKQAILPEESALRRDSAPLHSRGSNSSSGCIQTFECDSVGWADGTAELLQDLLNEAADSVANSASTSVVRADLNSRVSSSSSLAFSATATGTFGGTTFASGRLSRFETEFSQLPSPFLTVAGFTKTASKDSAQEKESPSVREKENELHARRLDENSPGRVGRQEGAELRPESIASQASSTAAIVDLRFNLRQVLSQAVCNGRLQSELQSVPQPEAADVSRREHQAAPLSLRGVLRAALGQAALDGRLHSELAALSSISEEHCEKADQTWLPHLALAADKQEEAEHLAEDDTEADRLRVQHLYEQSSQRKEENLPEETHKHPPQCSAESPKAQVEAAEVNAIAATADAEDSQGAVRHVVQELYRQSLHMEVEKVGLVIVPPEAPAPACEKQPVVKQEEEEVSGKAAPPVPAPRMSLSKQEQVRKRMQELQVLYMRPVSKSSSRGSSRCSSRGTMDKAVEKGTDQVKAVPDKRSHKPLRTLEEAAALVVISKTDRLAEVEYRIHVSERRMIRALVRVWHRGAASKAAARLARKERQDEEEKERLRLGVGADDSFPVRREVRAPPPRTEEPEAAVRKKSKEKAAAKGPGDLRPWAAGNGNAADMFLRHLDSVARGGGAEAVEKCLWADGLKPPRVQPQPAPVLREIRRQARLQQEHADKQSEEHVGHEPVLQFTPRPRVALEEVYRKRNEVLPPIVMLSPSNAMSGGHQKCKIKRGAPSLAPSPSAPAVLGLGEGAHSSLSSARCAAVADLADTGLEAAGAPKSPKSSQSPLALPPLVAGRRGLVLAPWDELLDAKANKVEFKDGLKAAAVVYGPSFEKVSQEAAGKRRLQRASHSLPSIQIKPLKQRHTPDPASRGWHC